MKNIVLVGFMGTGKTVVGKKLAKKLKMKYISTDDIIEIKERLSNGESCMSISKDFPVGRSCIGEIKRGAN